MDEYSYNRKLLNVFTYCLMSCVMHCDNTCLLGPTYMWINHLPPVCWSTFGILVWNDSGYVNLTQWWYFFIIFEYILHISTPHIMIFFFLYLIFLSQQVLYFLLSTLVLTLYIDVVLSLSMLLTEYLGQSQETPYIVYLLWYRSCD